MMKSRFLENALLLAAVTLALPSAAHANSAPEAQTNTGKFWRGDFAKPPFDPDWFVELSKGMERLTGKKPTRVDHMNDRKGDIVATREKRRSTVVSLADSINPVKDHFNANKGKHRFVALLSPT